MTEVEEIQISKNENCCELLVEIIGVKSKKEGRVAMILIVFSPFAYLFTLKQAQN